MPGSTNLGHSMFLTFLSEHNLAIECDSMLTSVIDDIQYMYLANSK